MDCDRYYQDQIDKSTINRLKKVSDFTGNQTGGFIRNFGNFLWKQNFALRKRAVDEHYQRVVEENDEKRKKINRKKKKITEIYGDGKEPF